MNILYPLITLSIIFTSCQDVKPFDYENNSSNSSGRESAREPSSLLKSVLNRGYCNQIIDKQYIKVCYSYSFKAAKAVVYELDGELVDDVNIKERPRFYEELSVPEAYRATYYDYKNSGYDRGHMAPDAAFDWSDDSLESVYSLANIVPQIPDVNQHAWVRAEEHARKEAKLHGKITVINLIKYSQDPKRIGTDKIAVADGFYKVMYNKDDGYKECFYYKNEYNTTHTLNSHLIDCKEVRY